VFHISRLQLFGSYVSAYVMLSIIGMIAGVILSVFLAKSRALPRSFVFRMTALVLFTGVLAQVFVSFIPRFMLPFSYLLGLFLSLALFLIIGKIFGYNPGDCAELGLISVNTYMIFSKLGCFLAGCCHGLPYTGFLSVVYAQGTHSSLPGIPLFPIQLTEVFVRFLLLFLMLIVYNKKIVNVFIIPLYVCLMALCYFWGMLFWYEAIRAVNQNGINYILIFNVIFGLGTVVIVTLLLISAKVKYIRGGANL